jgi:hypothetical protein
METSENFVEIWVFNESNLSIEEGRTMLELVWIID